MTHATILNAHEREICITAMRLTIRDTADDERYEDDPEALAFAMVNRTRVLVLLVDDKPLPADEADWVADALDHLAGLDDSDVRTSHRQRAELIAGLLRSR